MSILFRERPNSRSISYNPVKYTFRYSLTGTNDEAEALAYVLGDTPTTYGSCYRQTVELEPEGAGYWDVVVPYAPIAAPALGASRLSFDTTGGIAHRSYALEHIQSYAAAGDAPDHEGAIGVTDQGVEGCDVVVPQFKWVEEWDLSSAYASQTYAQTLKSLTGKVNAASFRNFQAGRVRFDGAQGGLSRDNPDLARIAFHFSHEDDVTGLAIGDISGISKSGFQYLWVEYEVAEDADSDTIVRTPLAAHVERVYDTGDFSLLGIGS